MTRRPLDSQQEISRGFLVPAELTHQTICFSRVCVGEEPAARALFKLPVANNCLVTSSFPGGQET